MKYFLALAICCSVILTSCDNTGAVPAVTSGNSAQTEQEVRNLLKEWITAITQQDTATLNRLAADEHVFTGFDGSTMTKRDNIESLSNPMFHIGSIQTEDVKVQTYGDAAVITGKAILKMTEESGSSESRTRFTQTWIRRNGAWQLVAEHTSQLP